MPNTTVLVAGNAPEVPRLRMLAQQLDVDGMVRFLGARTDVVVLNGRWTSSRWQHARKRAYRERIAVARRPRFGHRQSPCF